MPKLQSWATFFWLICVLLPVILRYYNLCLLTECNEEQKYIPSQLLFVLIYAIITQTHLMKSKHRSMRYKLCQVVVPIFVTQVAIEYIWMQIVFYNEIFLEILFLAMKTTFQTVGDSDFLSFLNNDSSVEVVLFVENLFVLYYAIKQAANPRSIYRLLKILFGVQQPNVSFAEQPDIRLFGRRDIPCAKPRSPERYRLFLPYYGALDVSEIFDECY